MRHFRSVVLALSLAFLLTSCSSGSGSSGGGTSSFVAGKWTLTLFGTQGFLVEFDMNLSRAGNAISSDSGNTVDNAICGGAHVDLSAGTVSGNQFKLVLSINNETATVTGTLSADGKSIAVVGSNFTSSSGGPCFDGVHGGFSANFVPSFSGSFTGTIVVSPVLGEPGVTAMFTEDPSFDLSGSMTVTNEPCFSSLATSPGNPGFAVGRLASFEMSDGTNVLDFTGQILTAGAPMGFEYDGRFNVTAGCTEEFDGQITLDPAMTAAAARVPAESIAKTFSSTITPLLVERLKALRAARLDHEKGRSL